MDKESACQCRGHRFDHWFRKVPHVKEQLSPCVTATEAFTLRACAPQKEATAVSPCTTLEKALGQQQTKTLAVKT